MADSTDIIGFDGGLNSDDEHRLVPNSDFLYALNFISGVRESGAVTNAQGNTLLVHIMPTGRNRCIGALRDIKRNAIIYFVWNSLGQHSILHFLCQELAIEEILAPSAALPNTGIPFDTSFLGFTEFNKIHSANILDDILTWVDGVEDDSNSPRKINIKRAKDFMQQLTPSVVNTPYDNLLATGVLTNKLQFVKAIKFPPINAPTVALFQDLTRQTNYIQNKMIQACYRYIYDDNEKSVWSEGSLVSLPQGGETVLGIVLTNVQNNYLQVTYNTGHPTVAKVDIAFRFGNLRTWYRLDEPIKLYNEDNERIIPMYTDETFNFYNDTVLIPIDPPETDKGFDAIPLKAGTQEIIDGNRLVYAETVEGLQNPVPVVELQFGNLQTPLPIESSVEFFLSGAGPEAWNIKYERGNVQLGSVISVNIVVSGVTTPILYVVTESDLNSYPFNLVESLKSTINRASGASPVSQTNASTSVLVVYSIATTTFNANVIYPPNPKLTSFKKGAFHYFALLYENIEGQNGGAAISEEMSLYIKCLPEIFITNTPYPSNTAFQTFVNMFISHIPPIWATRYKILYGGNSLGKWTQFILKGSQPTPDGNGNLILNCEHIIEYITWQRVVTSVNFDPVPGVDKIRFIANTENICAAYIETPILAWDSSTSLLTVGFFDISSVENMAVPSSDKMLVELFSNKKENDERFYFQIGQDFSIIQPGTPTRRHAGSNGQNQNSSYTTPAEINLTRGDCYLYRRFFKEANTQRIIESDNFSDFYDSANFDYSRVQGVRNEKTKLHGQLLRYGGRYFPDTLTNNLLSFDGDDFDTLNTTYGNICKVLTIGYVLKVYQTKKVWSIYIGREQTYNADGSPNLILVDRVIGNKDPSNTDFGCAHPTSVCKDDRQSYFFDVNNGCIVQDSANGLFPISSYKMTTYWKNVAQEIRSAVGGDKIFVYSASDNYNETINFTLSDENTDPTFTSTTIIYLTSINRWISFQSYVGDYIVSNALTLVTFKEGELYIHNSNAVPRNNFYGVQYSSRIKFVSNNNPEQVKLFNWIDVNSNKVWISPNDTDITITANANYPQGMASRLLAGKFRAKEGVFHAAYLRDLLTPNTDNPILNGRELRGTYLIHQMENSDTDKVILFSVLVHTTYSGVSG